MSGNYCEVCAGGGAALVGNEDASQYLCKECANEGTADDPRDADAYGTDEGDDSLGVQFGD